jgi:hypothetical protein
MPAARACEGGEQAANALQLDSSSRYATTAETKVGATLAALLLVKQRPCLFSHGRGLGFQACPTCRADGKAESSRWRRQGWS